MQTCAYIRFALRSRVKIFPRRRRICSINGNSLEFEWFCCQLLFEWNFTRRNFENIDIRHNFANSCNFLPSRFISAQDENLAEWSHREQNTADRISIHRCAYRRVYVFVEKTTTLMRINGNNNNIKLWQILTLSALSPEDLRAEESSSYATHKPRYYG